MDAGVGVAVGYIEFAVSLVYSDMSGSVERLSAHLGSRLVRDTECHEQFAVRGELADGTIAIVHAEDVAVGRDGYGVGVGEYALAPGIYNVALGVEDYHRTGAAIEYIDTVFGVHVH